MFISAQSLTNHDLHSKVFIDSVKPKHVLHTLLKEPSTTIETKIFFSMYTEFSVLRQL